MTRENNRRFHFLREIASGTFGSVYLAKEVHTDGFSRLVAIKLLHRRWSESEEVTRRMRDEARLLGWLRHRNIVDVVDLTAIDGRTAVIMEYLEAVDLRYVTEALREDGVHIPVRAALQMAACVAGALDAAYNRPPYAGEKPLRVIHRDIKPSNVMVDEGGTVKVLDFGVARADFESRESNTADLQFGSVDYMPPERLFFEPETPASDIYSLGATLYEILALERMGKAKGRPDRHAGFVRDRLSFLRAVRGLGGKLASGLDQLIIAMVDYEHADRPSAARVVEVCRDLSRIAPDQGLHDWAEAALPSILTRSRELESAGSALDGRLIEEDSSALRVRESGASSSFRAVPDPRFDSHGRPITPSREEEGARLGSAALAAVGAESGSFPVAPVAPVPAATPAPAAAVAPHPAPAPAAAEPRFQVPQEAVPPRPSPRPSVIPRMYSTGAFPRAQSARPRAAEPRRGGLAPFDPEDQGWDDEHEATAQVEPELLEALRAGRRPTSPPVVTFGQEKDTPRAAAPAASPSPPPPAERPRATAAPTPRQVVRRTPAPAGPP
ncbi:MAG: serine/threonine-protein kinase, partial [Pseudomonadota bacterium]